jgi:hypothetical protein
VTNASNAIMSGWRQVPSVNSTAWHARPHSGHGNREPARKPKRRSTRRRAKSRSLLTTRHGGSSSNASSNSCFMLRTGTPSVNDQPCYRARHRQTSRRERGASSAHRLQLRLPHRRPRAVSLRLLLSALTSSRASVVAPGAVHGRVAEDRERGHAPATDPSDVTDRVRERRPGHIVSAHCAGWFAPGGATSRRQRPPGRASVQPGARCVGEASNPPETSVSRVRCPHRRPRSARLPSATGPKPRLRRAQPAICRPRDGLIDD